MILGIKEDRGMKKIYAIVMMAAALAACNQEELPQIVEEPEAPTYTMNIEATKGEDDNTKALSLSGKALNATWAEGEAVTVYNVTRSADLSGTLTAQSSGTSTVLKGTLTGTIQNGDELKLMFCSPSYASQTGTLEYIAANCDYAEATVTVTDASTPSVTTTAASFVNQQAIVKFTLLKKADDSNLVIPAETALTVNDGTNNYTITPTSATNVLFVAIPATSTVSLSKVLDGFDYYYIKNGASLIAGNYYEITVKMSPRLAVKRAGDENYTVLTGHTTVNDGDLLAGVLFDDYKVSIANGATVTLRDVTINRGNGSNYWAGLSCIGDATIVLADGTTNTIKGFYEDYPGIYIPVGNTLTIQGTGTLNACSNGYAAGIGGGWSLDCGNILIKSGIINATGARNAAGIGAGFARSCGNIEIQGGTITASGEGAGIGTGNGVDGEDEMGSPEDEFWMPGAPDSPSSCGTITISGGTIDATGGYGAAGIGTGEIGNCGNITITDGVTRVTATKGGGWAQHSIGRGGDGYHFQYHGKVNFTVTIGGSNVGYISTSPYTYEP